MRCIKWILAAFLALMLAGCVTFPKKPDKRVLLQSSYQEVTDWPKDDLVPGFKAFLASCARKKMLPSHVTLDYKGLGSRAEWLEVCAKAETIDSSSNQQIRIFFEQHFNAYKVTNHFQENGLFTGYYEPSLNGSFTRSARYTYPLYQVPKTQQDRQKNRAEINSGELEHKGLELLYVEDAVKAFFMQIQGSGRIILENGEEIRVNYAGQNGQPYFAIGKYFLQEGLIPKDKLSAQAIMAWLYAHPQEAQKIMEKNPSYVYFRINPKKDGPIGAEGIALTPERSLAIDKRFLPYGVPLWLDTTYPSGKESGCKPVAFRKLMVTQDTGGALKGPVRGDIFFGHGKDAARLAGEMKQPGSYFIFLPKTVTPKPTYP